MRGLGWVLLAMVVGCDGGGGDTDTDPVDRTAAILALTGDPVNGGTLWSQQCNSCHSGLEGVYGDLPAADVVDAMLTGPGSMPEFSGYSDQELADILAFMQDAA